MYVYRIAPIDFWAGWMDEATLLQQLAMTDSADDLPSFKATALSVALTRLEWEGDMREGPFYAGIPTNMDYWPSFMMAWKQDNNGSTFVATPQALPWLADDDARNFVKV